MGHEIDLNKYNIRTDLVLDSIIGNENNISHKVDNYGDISVNTVYIADNNGKLSVDVYVNVFYGYNVSEIAYKVQENIKNSLASMIDVEIDKVNVHVLCVDFIKDEDKN